LNLINNSFQAIGNSAHPWIRIKCEDLSDSYRISIIDSGTGVDPKFRSKLFQPFFTTKEIGVGTGLGLGISKGIIEEHQGRLYYDDDALNTTFVIELPKLKTS
jgi:C4-dicarboxylate-specific signal transduction histidine kinase